MDLNRQMLMGRAGGDPVIRTLESGARVASFSLATARKWTSKEGETKEETTWHNVVVWNKACVTFAEKYVSKGDVIYVEGRTSRRKWVKEDGSEVPCVEVIVDGYGRLNRPSNKAVVSEPATEAAAPAPADTETASSDDEIPF